MINIEQLMKSLSDEHFMLAKNKFAGNIGKLSDIKGNKLVSTLLEIMYCEEHLCIMSREEFARIFSAFFYDKLNDKNCIRDYLLLIKSKICDKKGNWHTADRAKKYTDFLMEKYSDDTKNKKYTNDYDEVELIEKIADYINIVLALIGEHIDKNITDNNIKDLNFNIHEDVVLEFVELLYTDYNIFDYNLMCDNQEVKKGGITQIIGGVGQKMSQRAEQKNEKKPERVLAYFLTWFFYLKISNENGYIFELEVE